MEGRLDQAAGRRDGTYGRGDTRPYMTVVAGISVGNLTEWMTIDDEAHLLLDGVDAAICRLLVVQESIVIPVRSQIDIPTKTVFSNQKTTWDSEGASWMAESGEARCGLPVDRNLVPIRITEVPVCVMNVLHHPVTWEKGEEVSVLKQ